MASWTPASSRCERFLPADEGVSSVDIRRALVRKSRDRNSPSNGGAICRNWERRPDDGECGTGGPSGLTRQPFQESELVVNSAAPTAMPTRRRPSFSWKLPRRSTPRFVAVNGAGALHCFATSRRHDRSLGTMAAEWTIHPFDGKYTLGGAAGPLASHPRQRGSAPLRGCHSRRQFPRFRSRRSFDVSTRHG